MTLDFDNASYHSTLDLPSGRTLGYARYGHAGGRPVFYFTGGNSSRFEGLWFEQAALEKQIDLIVPDRPGFGLSGFQPGRRFADWPVDVAALADALGIDRFAVFGLSGGSPHTLAVAHALPARVTRAAVVSGVAPPEMPDLTRGMWPPVKLIYFTGKRWPAANRFLLKQMAGFYADEAQMLKRMKQALPKPDVALIDARPEVISIFSKAAGEAHRQGVDGDHHEWQLYVQPWGFDLAEIKVEIGLWYGEVDRNVPLAMGRYLDARLPNSRLVVVPDGGHFSTINNYIAELFDFLAPADR